MNIAFYNTKSKTKENFIPIDKKNIRMYVCGPTVYDRAHIGNARPAVVFDLLFRFLRHIYGAENITYVRNFTDIDDKINQKAKDTGRDIRIITDETINWYLDDMTYLNVLNPTCSPRATDYVDAMIQYIQGLIDKGNAYSDKTGHVFFSVDTYPHYGHLSKRKLDEMELGNRIKINKSKNNPMDFVLWKPSDLDTPGWDSPWGRGRPGWHIECSVMSYELLGPSFDIHGGGIDLLFPHHENEVAQSCCAYPNEQFSNFWMHNGFVQIKGEKMSKSLNNFLTVQDLIRQGISGDTIRLVLLSAHYRQPLDWTIERVNQMSGILRKWRKLCDGISPSGEPSKVVLDALSDDLNTPMIIAELHRLASMGEFSTLLASAQLLGLLSSKSIQEPKKIDTKVKSKIEELIEKRSQAKLEKNFVLADLIRKKITDAGILIKDNAVGTEWEIGSDYNDEKLKDL